MLAPTAPTPSKIRSLRLRPEDVGDGLEQGPELGVPVAGPPHRFGIEPERGVVDEHPPIHLGEVDPALAAVDERVESADDVVAIDPEVEGEVVARPGGNAGVRQTRLGGDRRDNRLRAVASGHRQRVGAVRDRAPHQFLEVIVAPEFKRLDTATSRLVGEAKARRLAAAGLWIEEQHRATGCGGARKDDVNGERPPSGGRGHGRQDHDRHARDQVTSERDEDDGTDQRQRREPERDATAGAPPPDPVPAGRGGDRHTRHDGESVREARERDDDRNDHRGYGEAQRGDRRQSLSVHG